MFERWHRYRRRAVLRDQWPTALVFVAGALKAGLSIEQAFEALRVEAPEPLKSVLNQRIDETWEWMPPNARVDTLFAEPDLALARAALILTRETGGQTARLLERSANALRIKNEIEDRASALSAQGRASAWVVGLTPPGILVLFGVFSPDYLAPLFTTRIGFMVLGVVAVLILIGLMLVHRLARVEL